MGPEHTIWWPWAGMWIFPMIMFAMVIIFILLFDSPVERRNVAESATIFGPSFIPLAKLAAAQLIQ